VEPAVIRKRLNTFKSGKGTLTRVSDDVVMEVLRGWESWAGTAAAFYREIGISKQQLWVLIKKGKNLVKSGKVLESEFREISLPVGGQDTSSAPMELKLDSNRTIRFSQVDHLVEFMKKAHDSAQSPH
jgi:hypothetical protein